MRTTKQKECIQVSPPLRHTFSRAKRRALALTLTLCMVLALVPVFTMTASAAVCEIDGKGVYDSLADALLDADPGDTIVLTDNIDCDPIVLGKAIAFQLGDNTLTIGDEDESGTALECDGDYIVAAFFGSGKVIINGDVTARADNEETCGVWAGIGAEVTVNGDVEVNGGDDGAKVCGVYANNGATVTVNGDITVSGGGDGAEVSGVWAIESAVTVSGSIDVSGGGDGDGYKTLYVFGVEAKDAVVEVGGDITVESSGTDRTMPLGVSAYDDAEVIVGNITVSGDAAQGVVADYDATVTVNGNIKVSGDEAEGVSTESGAAVTVNGSITVPDDGYYIVFDGVPPKSKGQNDAASAKYGYLQYSCEFDPGVWGYVWVKEEPKAAKVKYYQDSMDNEIPGSESTAFGEYYSGKRLTPADVTDDFKQGWLDAEKPGSRYRVALVSYPTITGDPGRDVVKVLYKYL